MMRASRLAQLSALSLLTLLVIGGLSASADCLDPPFAVHWSYPADGQQNVPSDATFWLLATPSGRVKGVEATLDGHPLVPIENHHNVGLGLSAFRLFQGIRGEARALSANRSYTLRVRYVFESEPDRIVVVRFTSSGEHAGVAHTRVRSLEQRDSSFSEDHPCHNIVQRGMCFCHRLELRKFVLDSANTIGWYIKVQGSDEMRFWPSVCGDPAVFLDVPDPRRCFYVYGVDARGDVASVARHCGAPKPFQSLPKNVAAGYAGPLKTELVADEAGVQAALPAAVGTPASTAQPAETQTREPGCGGCSAGGTTHVATGWALGLLSLWRRRTRRPRK